MNSRWFWRRVGSLALLLTLLLAGCQAPQPTAPVPLPKRTVAADPAAAQRLLDRINQAIESNANHTTLRLYEQEVTSLAEGYVQGSAISNVTLWIEPDHICLQATYTGQGQHDLRVRLWPTVQDGEIALSIDAFSIDRHAIPRWIRASMAHAASDALSDASLPLTVDEIALQEGVMVLKLGR